MRKRASISCFGIMLWELCAERVPYGDMTPLQVRARLSFKAGYLTGSFALVLEAKEAFLLVLHIKNVSLSCSWGCETVLLAGPGLDAGGAWARYTGI